MSFEYKSIDIENDKESDIISLFSEFGWELKSSQRIFSQDTRPIGAVTFNSKESDVGLTYIHSQTNTVDYTKLVFQRDNSLPNLSRVRELEREFWQLSSTCPAHRPTEPEYMPLEEWAISTHASIYSDVERILAWIGSGLVFTVIWAIVFAITLTIDEGGGFFKNFITAFFPCLIAGAVCGGVWFNLYDFIKRKSVYVNEKSKHHKSVRKRYEEYIAIMDRQKLLVEHFDETMDQMSDIIAEANVLLDKGEI